MLAALLGWSQGTFASKVELGDGSAKVTREVDGGLQTVELKLPAIVTTDLRLNQPRYASLPNIMKAKKKPLDEKSAADFGVEVKPRLKVLKTEEPAGRKAGVKVKSRRGTRRCPQGRRHPLRVWKRRILKWQFCFSPTTTTQPCPTRRPRR
jgi:electron transfer flavoprotein alpha/beta subunit